MKKFYEAHSKYSEPNPERTAIAEHFYLWQLSDFPSFIRNGSELPQQKCSATVLSWWYFELFERFS